MSALGILIVGAGPTGLTAAVELARRGIIADVIDRNDGPSPLSRAVGILPVSMATLAPSGVAGEIRKQAVTCERLIFHKGAIEAARLRLDILDGPDMRLFCLAQDRTEGILRAAFERLGGKVQFSARLEGVDAIDGSVSATINGKKHNYDYVIGADGKNSVVRRAMGIAYDGFDLPENWSIADVEVDGWPDPRAFKIYLLPQASGVIVAPLEAARFRVIGNSEDALAMLPVPMKIRKLRRSATFQISVRQADRYQQGRVFLAGDAAHCHSPAGGRGMNLGIADAADLAARFAEGGLEGYHTARHAEGRKVLEVSEQGRRTVMSKNPVKRAVFLSVLRLAQAVPALNRKFAERMLVDK